MARAPRNYAAEYERRQARARSEGYLSYWDKRTAPPVIRTGMSDDARRKMRAEIGPEGRRLSSKDLAKGHALLRAKDFKGADALARKRGIRARKGMPPGRVFWYHFE